MSKLTPRERAIWAICGDPYSHIPLPLVELVNRIETAIKQAITAATKEVD